MLVGTGKGWISRVKHRETKFHDEWPRIRCGIVVRESRIDRSNTNVSSPVGRRTNGVWGLISMNCSTPMPLAGFRPRKPLFAVGRPDREAITPGCISSIAVYSPRGLGSWVDYPAFPALGTGSCRHGWRAYRRWVVEASRTLSGGRPLRYRTAIRATADRRRSSWIRMLPETLRGLKYYIPCRDIEMLPGATPRSSDRRDRAPWLQSRVPGVATWRTSPRESPRAVGNLLHGS
jgi:hypothetical protein